MYFRGQRKSASDVSLSECIETGRDGNALSLMDVICSEEDLFEQLSEKEIYGRLHAAVNTCLTPREQRIILLRYGLGNRKPLTQREIAVQCGISRSYVSRIEKRALQKLEDALTKEPEGNDHKCIHGNISVPSRTTAGRCAVTASASGCIGAA